MYQITTLKNKLKIITHSMPNVHGVTAGVFVKTGSRYESDKVAGISHFMEHMLFKGTTKRPSPADISRSIEGIGGYLNAATGQEHTFLYNRVPYQHTSTAVEFLSDILNNSLFNPQIIKREKNVILEELNMYLDTPTRYIYDLMTKVLWPQNSLGRQIIGTKQSLKQIQQEDFLNYLKSNYQPQHMLFSLAGRVNHSQVVKQVKKYFDHNKNSRALKFKPVKQTQKQPRILIHPKQTDQVHLGLAVPALAYGHQDENILTLLDIILGTGMSSRLFLNIREKRGLCYYINSFVERFQETGIFGITAGLNTDKIDLAIKAIINELKELASFPVSSQELKEAKEYLRGSLNLQMDNTDNMAVWYGVQGLFYKKIKTPQQKIKELLQVTQSDIIKLARKLFNSRNLNLALIGPFSIKDKNRFLKNY